MSAWFENGQPVAGIAPSDRGFRYGDGLFETLAVRGGEPRLWHLHAKRLVRGLAQLGIDGPDPNKCLEQVLLALSAASIGLERATARLVVTAGKSARGYSRANDTKPGIFVEVTASPSLDDALYETGATVIRCETRASWQPALAGLKTLNRLDQVLARREWSDKSVFEGLMCDRDDRVICGTMSNVFILSNNEIQTPRLDSAGVAGVMRQLIIEMCDGSKRPVHETRIAWDDLVNADEVFLSNSQFGVMPVTACGELSWPVGAVTRDVRSALIQHGVVEGPA